MEVVEYEPRYRQDFVRLNTEWLEKLCYIEPYDQYAMDHVDELIQQGAMVYVAVEGGEVLAVCMTQPLGDDVWEICKLAARGQYTGTGAGSAVLRACMAYSIARGARKLCLITISSLGPAIHLYRKFGFREVPYRRGVWHSEKADVEMEYLVPQSLPSSGDGALPCRDEQGVGA